MIKHGPRTVDTSDYNCQDCGWPLKVSLKTSERPVCSLFTVHTLIIEISVYCSLYIGRES